MNIQNNSEITQFIVKLIKFSIPSWVGFAINIIAVAIITRFFSPDEYGLINTFNVSSTLIMALACLGLDSGYIRYYYDPPNGFDRNRLFLMCINISLITSIFLLLLSLGVGASKLSKLILGIDNYIILFLLFGNVVSLIFVRFMTIFFRMSGDTFLFAILSIGMQLALKGALIFASFINPNFEFAVFSSVIAVFTMVIVFLFFTGRKMIPKNKLYSISEIKSIRSLLTYSIYTWPVPILLYLNTLITLIIIRVKLGNEAVGIFASVGVFIGILGVFQAGFSTFWSAYMFENYKTKVTRIIRMHNYVSFFTITAMVGLIIFRDIIFMLLGGRYQVSKPFFALLLLYPLLILLVETTSYGISIAKKSVVLLIVTCLSVFLNIFISFIFIPHWGLLGACAGSAVSGLFFFTLQSYYGQKYYKSIENIRRTIFTVLTLVILALSNFILINSFGQLIMISLIFFLFAGFVYRKDIFYILNYAKNNNVIQI